MYCGKCGTEVPDGFEYCMKCGTKISATDSSIATLTKKKKWKLIIPILIVLLLAVSAGVYFIFLRAPEIEGTYVKPFYSKSIFEYRFALDDGSSTKGTYEEWIDDFNLINGTYEVKNGQVTTTGIMLGDTYIETYDIYKGYLVPAEYSYDGIIPNSKTFDVKCSKDESYYQFNADGTLSRQFKNSDDQIVNQSGTYQRDGDLIKFKIEGQEGDFTLLIYKGRINLSYIAKK
jgi:hypothetical protein